MLSLRRACVPSVLLLLSQLSRTEALLTGIAAPRRHGAVSVQANLLTKANLLFSDLVLKAQVRSSKYLLLSSLRPRGECLHLTVVCQRAPLRGTTRVGLDRACHS